MNIFLKQERFIFVVFVIYIALILFSVLFRMDPYLWFDEAGQFFIAKGLNHDSAPLSIEGGLFEVISNNHDYNLDPGGFSILLHYWSKVSSTYFWLRLLPFTFFVLFVICLIKYIYLKTSNLMISMLLGFVPFLFPLTYTEAFEIRAYSMETLGVIISVLCVDWIQEDCSRNRLLVTSFLLSLFVFSRYSFVIDAFVASLLIMCFIVKTPTEWKCKLLNIMLFAFPILVTLVLIYFIAFRYQSVGTMQFNYMHYLSDNPKMLLWDTSLPFVGNLLVIIFFIMNHKNPMVAKYRNLLIMTACNCLIFIILSILGLHPWQPKSQHCISMISFILICNTMILAELCCVLKRYIKIHYLLMCMIVFMFSTNYTNIKSLKGEKDNNVLTMLENLDLDSCKKIYCDRWESPCIRYQYEYGSLKNKQDDYSKYEFATMLKHTIYTKYDKKSEFYKNQPELDSLLGYDMLIVPELSRYKSKDVKNWIYQSEGVFIRNYK